MKYYEIAVNYPIGNGVLTYGYDDKSKEESLVGLKRGTLVQVPLRSRSELGCILGEVKSFDPDAQKYKTKNIIEVEKEFHLNDDELKLYEWMSHYYHYSLGKLISDSLPKRLKRPQKVAPTLGSEARQVNLTESQGSIFKNISKKLFTGFSQHLIHGITGSGKSMIYLKLMQEVAKRGESSLFVLPEINLTPQFMKMFSEHLDVPVYQYHSSVTNSQKYTLWKKLKEENEPCVIVGVRSSLFLPIENLGLIVVDEEHDSSFKQDDRCAYHGRDVAIYKALVQNTPIILGSATPSVESYYRFKTKPQENCFYHPLYERYGEGRLPEIIISDLKKDGGRSEDKELEFFTSKSLELLDNAIEKNEQVLIFVNRLGFAHYFQCRQCGFVHQCPNCAVNLKIYKKKQVLICHHCDFQKPEPKDCEECGSLSFYHRGFGTEQVELKFKEIRPDIKFDRFDRDEIKNFKDLKLKLEQFEQEEFEVLIGTQMLSKGHNFKKVNLVLILGIDHQLNFPDFRANERVFQLVNQVSGRAGRFHNESKVVIETLSPENPLWMYLDEQSEDFYQMEIGIRALCECPPYKKLAVIYLTSSSYPKLSQSIESLTPVFKSIENQLEGITLHGPKPAPIEKRVNKYTWLYLIKSSDPRQMNRFIESSKKYLKIQGISVKIDVDPLGFF